MLSTYMCVLIYIKACTHANICIEFIWKDTGKSITFAVSGESKLVSGRKECKGDSLLIYCLF